ncbi:MAG: ribose 5-phosphate isomerase B [Ruminococcus sp.]|nr:ribose 5-phosphate isomerase B [Ruminococcus sp.]
MKIWIGCDHAGFDRKREVIAYLKEQNMDVTDCSCQGECMDYPVIAKRVADAVLGTSGSFGILICGTGLGMSIAANKVKGIRATLCTETFSAKYARLHNDANILCIGARTLGSGVTIEIVDTFLHTDFEGGRHETRVNMIHELENK